MAADPADVPVGDTCYRHPGLHGGVRCQRCDRPICPACMRQASVGFHCPECTARGGTRVIHARALTARPANVTAALVATNLAVYVWSVTDPSVLARGALFGPAVAAGEWWRLVTHAFVHVNLLHVGMNMLLAWMLGRILEGDLGPARFAALYAASVAGGALGVMVLDPTAATVGASGGVFGLMGALFMGLRNRGVDPWQTGIGGLVVANLVITFVIPGISIGGHLGGLVAGSAAGALLVRPTRAAARGPVGLVAVTVLAGLLFTAARYLAP